MNHSPNLFGIGNQRGGFRLTDNFDPRSNQELGLQLGAGRMSSPEMLDV